MFGSRSSAARSSAAKPPSGPISTASGIGPAVGAARLRQRGDRVLYLRVLVAEDQKPGGIALGDHPVQAQRRGNFRQRQDAALLGRLDRIGAHAVEVDARDLGVPGDDRLQARRAHLDRLLRHVVEARMLERREQVMQVERSGLRPGAGVDLERELARFRRRRERPAIRRRDR